MAALVSIKVPTIDAIAAYLLERALIRENRLAADHPLLELFWDTYDYLNANYCINGKYENFMNHSADETLIAINLNEFRERSQMSGQQHFDMGVLKKLFPTGKKHKLVDTNRTVRSKTNRHAIIKCWVFQK